VPQGENTAGRRQKQKGALRPANPTHSEVIGRTEGQMESVAEDSNGLEFSMLKYTRLFSAEGRDCAMDLPN
jgi:hypothetical protein